MQADKQDEYPCANEGAGGIQSCASFENMGDLVAQYIAQDAAEYTGGYSHQRHNQQGKIHLQGKRRAEDAEESESQRIRDIE